MSDDFGYSRYRANVAWLRANAPTIVLLMLGAFMLITSVYAWGHAMGKRDLLIAAGIAGSEVRGG
jgi:hypothetical protein